MIKKLFLLVFFITIPANLIGQIIPPGLGDIGHGSWFAFGVNQKLDSLKNEGWQSSTYVGIGSISHSNDFNLFKDFGIFVLNQEFYNQFDQDWEYSLAISYRHQNLYQENEPFQSAQASAKNEFRFYSRFSYLYKSNFVDITPTLRQEIIKYLTPDFKNYTENWRLRTRFRLKFSFPLNIENTQKLIFYSEQLFSVSQEAETKKWDNFKYKDSRFALYYSIRPHSFPVTFNLGYMLNLVGTKSTYTGHYLALDIIWKNPF